MTRPSLYSVEIAERICSEIAQGRALNKIVQEEWCPDYTTICRWLRANEEFCQMYRDAREDQGQVSADEIVDLSDVEPPIVEGRVDAAWVSWMKNRIDARKWVAAKLKPRVYGDRSHSIVEATIKQAKPLSDLEALAEIAELSQQLGGKYQLVEVVDEDDA